MPRPLPAAFGSRVRYRSQERGVELLLLRRSNGINRAASLQVKYSRAYEGPGTNKFKFVLWFKRFLIPEQADFFVLAALYPNVTGRGRGLKSSWWSSLLLLFTRQQMTELICSLRTRSGRPDHMFYLAFDSPERVILTRGAAEAQDFSSYTFKNQLGTLRAYLGG